VVAGNSTSHYFSSRTVLASLRLIKTRSLGHMPGTGILPAVQACSPIPAQSSISSRQCLWADTMFRFRSVPRGDRCRLRAARALFVRYGAERTPEGKSLRLLRGWLSPTQGEQLAKRGYFEVVGNDSGRRYRIYVGTSVNVCEVDEKGRLGTGLCFMPTGTLPTGDVMLAQKIALETREDDVCRTARRFVPSGFHFRPHRRLG